MSSHLTMFVCSLFLLIILPALCVCVDTPPRSPTPVPLDLLNFDDYKDAFLEPNHGEDSRSPYSSPQRARMQPANPRYDGTASGERSDGRQSIPQTNPTTKPHSKGGRKRILPKRERVLTPKERKDRWKSKQSKSKGDPDFVFKQSRKRKMDANKSSKKGKAASSDSSSSW